MTSPLNSLLTARGAVFADQRITSFGAPESDTLHEGVNYVVPLTHLALLRVSGADASSFLQNLLTNDAVKLAPDRAQHNGLCSPKGRLLASFLMWREGEDFCLALSADLAAGVVKKLSMYVLRSKVSITLEESTRALLGWIGAVPDMEDYSVLQDGARTLIRLPGGRLMMAVPLAEISALLEPSGRILGASNVWETLDIACGLPLITAATQEAFVPQMVNFDLLGGVSFKKGCYPGQEIVARTQYLGKLKKRMVRAAVAQVTPLAGQPIFGVDLADQACGEIVTVATRADGRHEMLAVVQLSSLAAGPLCLQSATGPQLEILPLPYDLPE